MSFTRHWTKFGFVLFGLGFTCINIYYINSLGNVSDGNVVSGRYMQRRAVDYPNPNSSADVITTKSDKRTSDVIVNNNTRSDAQLTVWVPSHKLTGKAVLADWPLRIHHVAVVRRLGYQFGDENDDWDFLWGYSTDVHKYAERKLPHPMKPHQKVNLVPGSAYIGSKKELSKLRLPYMPKTFRLPREESGFQNYLKKKPDSTWLVKSATVHNGQGVSVLKSHEFPKDKTMEIQELISNPYLIFGRKFDLAVYVAVTSVDPLRVYIHTGDWFIRYCPKEYHPFNPDIRDKYIIIRETFNTTWEIPGLRDVWYKYGLSNKDAVLWHVKENGGNPAGVEKQIEDIVRDVFLKHQDRLRLGKQTMMYDNVMYETDWSKIGDSRNFFELVRFDFLLDADLKVHLIEVNGGPGMGSRREGHSQRRQQNERTIYSLLRLVGLAPETRTPLLKSKLEDREMQISKNDLATFGNRCTTLNCTGDCRSRKECDLCLPCMTQLQKDILALAAQEHFNKYDWKRAIPAPFKDQSSATNWDPAKDKTYTTLYDINQWMYRWFRGKCIKDSDWCQ